MSKLVRDLSAQTKTAKRFIFTTVFEDPPKVQQTESLLG